MSSDHHRGFLSALIGDGRPLLTLTGLALILAGGFALFLSASGSFLPHDVDFLGMQPSALCAINECRIVHFMFHDRFSFGGVMIAIGTLYLWLSAFPLRERQSWAWWTFALSGLSGFGSFLCYLGYGYLDSWHGMATLALLPCFLLGLFLTRRDLVPDGSWRSLLSPGIHPKWNSSLGRGRICLLFTGLGMIAGGAVIMTVGMTTVFVPEDIAFMGLTADRLFAINPRLVPLIAHDRAGFGGGLMSCGILVLLIVWKGQPSRHLWQALLCAGAVGFGCAIGVHYPIGYRNPIHLAPAWLGALIFILGIVLSYRGMCAPKDPTGINESRPI